MLEKHRTRVRPLREYGYIVPGNSLQTINNPHAPPQTRSRRNEARYGGGAPFFFRGSSSLEELHTSPKN